MSLHNPVLLYMAIVFGTHGNSTSVTITFLEIQTLVLSFLSTVWTRVSRAVVDMVGGAYLYLLPALARGI